MKRTAPKTAPAAESGAPAALEAIAKHELRCRESVDKLYAELQDAKASRNEDDDVSMRVYNRIHRDYLDALEEWDAARKSLLAFDTKISPSRREGEKVSVEEVREIFAQLLLSIRLAVEQVIIADSQSAPLCESAEKFHVEHAHNYRAAMEGAIVAARDDGKLPKWVESL